MKIFTILTKHLFFLTYWQYLLIAVLVVYCHGSIADKIRLELLRVEDGDTIVVDNKGAEVRIQLSGIDAPETVENAKLKLDIKTTGLDGHTLLAIGNAATQHLNSLLPPGKLVVLDADLARKDDYGRVPAIVFNAYGRELNEAMVEDGYASILTRYPIDADFRSRLQHHQAAARKRGLGLWGRYPEISKAWFRE
jgi:micrococcal nuclease